ncbi:hypothetical protein GQ42DRAFT_21153 [Ramicandelaber brevisporus]|nr:hypothetical protein GQ42DRAFT_21153 [Ramicandelaber brevisporus]
MLCGGQYFYEHCQSCSHAHLQEVRACFHLQQPTYFNLILQHCSQGDTQSTSGVISKVATPTMSYSFGFGNGVYITDLASERSRKYTYSGAQATKDYWTHGYTG